MNTQRKIKIIKGAQRKDDKSEAATGGGQVGVALPDSNRVVAGRVSAWVREFQQRRLADPRRAFSKLFAEPALNS